MNSQCKSKKVIFLTQNHPAIGTLLPFLVLGILLRSQGWWVSVGERTGRNRTHPTEGENAAPGWNLMSKAGLDGAWTSCSAGRCPCPWNEELPKVPSTQSSPWPCNHLPCASLEVPWAAVRAQSPGEGRTGWLQRCPAGTGAVLSYRGSAAPPCAMALISLLQKRKREHRAQPPLLHCDKLVAERPRRIPLAHIFSLRLTRRAFFGFYSVLLLSCVVSDAILHENPVHKLQV